MRVVRPDDNLCLFGPEVLHECIQRLGHMGVTQVPRRDSLAEHRAVIFFGILHQASILFSKEEFIRERAAIAAGKIGSAAAHFGPLADGLILAALAQPKASRVSVGLSVLAKMFETGITIASASCSFG